MEEEKNKVTVNIFGNKYTIKGDGNPEYIQELAQFVDKKMQEIVQFTSTISSYKVAILAALNIADEFYRVKIESEATQRIVEERATNLITRIEEELK